MNVDKIPIETLIHSPGDETYHLGTLEITKGEYAMAEKFNELVEWCRELQENQFKRDNK